MAIVPAALIDCGEKAIAAGALAAAGLFGSLPYDGKSLAQDGVPVQRHDIARVGVTGVIDPITYETSLDDSLYSDLFNSSTGLYADVYNGAVSALGASTADTVLGTGDLGGGDLTGLVGTILDDLGLDSFGCNTRGKQKRRSEGSGAFCFRGGQNRIQYSGYLFHKFVF